MKKKIYCVFSLIILFFLFLSFNNVYATENYLEFTVNENYTEFVNDKNYYEKREEYTEIVERMDVLGNNEQTTALSLFRSSSTYDKNEIIDYIVEESRKNVSDAQLYQRIDGSITEPINFYDISKYNLSQTEAYNIILECYERPEMFYVITLGLDNPNEAGYIPRIYVEYYMTQEEIDSEFAIIENAVKEYKKGVDSNWNDLEKLVYTNNYVCSLVQYNYDEASKETEATDGSEINYRIHKLNGGLVDKLPVCDGYSRTLNYLLSSVGIKSSIVSSVEMCHAWSMVELNNNYYHIDVTWNDLGNYGKSTYEYFLLSDIEIQDRNHYNYSSWEFSEDITYDNHDMVWNKTVNYLIYNSGYWYYLDNYSGNIPSNSPVKEIRLNKFDVKNNKLISTKTIDIGALEDEIYFAPGLTQKDNKLCFSTNTKFYYMDVEGANIRVVHIPELANDEYLYSVEYVDDKFYYNSVQVDANVSVGYRILSDYFSPVESIELNKAELNLFVNDSQTITATVLPTNTTDNVKIIWSSSDETIAKVDVNGKVTGLKSGKVIITASYNEIIATCEVDVNERIPVKSIELNKTELNLFVNEPQTITATVLPTNTTDNVNIVWKSSDENIAKVDSNGKITGLKKGEAVITVSSNGVYASCKVTVIDKLPFPDVSPSAWYYGPVKFNYLNNIILGFDDGNFKPNTNLTRGMLVTILYRIEGIPDVSTLENSFKDVNSKAYYYNAVKWAVNNGIVYGYDGGIKFKPDNNILRQDLICMLTNYAKYKKIDVNSNISLSNFSDSNNVSSYALGNVKWAIEKGIIRGKGDRIAPKDTATRAEVAAMISNYFEVFK